MSLDLKFQSLVVKPIGTTVTIPENRLAKLMYYLDCVLTVIEYTEDTKYTDFSNYHLLSKEDEEVVKSLAVLFNPKIMLELKLFVLEPNLVPFGSSNKFYEISDKRLGLHANSEVVIAGKSIRVLKIMACKESWITCFFTDPMDEYIEKYISSAPQPVTQKKKTCHDNCFCKFLKVFGITFIVVLISFGIYKLLEYYIL